MAFKLALTPTYKVKIIVDIPNEQGKFDQSDFMAEFLRCDFDRLNDLQTKSIAEVMHEMLIGWSGLVDSAGNELPYNEANKTALLKIPQALQALGHHYWSTIFKAREKN
ncbi:hypothetical protein [uncultured Oxalobacter sp.]|uniref:hypothetical protein n=1 Tax=uncultured Oxalobacter sp. TaxID=337245 RepID=UPI0025957629|nr:hypothetical protein [uncultured Oxalobacter sp.]